MKVSKRYIKICMVNSNRSAAIRAFSRETRVGIGSVRIVVRPLDRTWEDLGRGG